MLGHVRGTTFVDRLTRPYLKDDKASTPTRLVIFSLVGSLLLVVSKFQPRSDSLKHSHKLLIQILLLD